VNFDAKAAIDLNFELKYEAGNDWANYPLGVVEEFKQRGFSGRGFDVLYHGDIPNGAGLSSSASIELVTAVMLNDIYDAGIPMIELVKLSQRAENKFVGINCGIMDQFASGMGKKGSAMLLNCQSLEYSYVPLDITGCKIVIANTNKKRGLVDSKYNERRDECERAVEMLRQKLDINFLCEMDKAVFEAHRHLITDAAAQKRAEHVVYENARTLAAVDLLTAGDLRGFGKLLNESHESLKTLYEVTGVELDALAEAAQGLPSVYGSRMTGAGFGGCTVSVVEDSGVQEFISVVGEKYTAATGLVADFYIAETGDGARKLQR
jgi:galactokinase